MFTIIICYITQHTITSLSDILFNLMNQFIHKKQKPTHKQSKSETEALVIQLCGRAGI